MKTLVCALALLFAVPAFACNSSMDCGIGDQCVNANTLQSYFGMDDAGVCVNSMKLMNLQAQREMRQQQNDQGCCSWHGGIEQSQIRMIGMPVECADFSTSPTCVWK